MYNANCFLSLVSLTVNNVQIILHIDLYISFVTKYEETNIWNDSSP